MRSALFLSLLLLGSCTGKFDHGGPGLDVADVALANNEPATALRIAEQVLAGDPRNEPALVRMAAAQAALGQRDQAARSFARALSIAPDDPAAALGLGRLELAADPAQAADLLLRLSTRDPRNVAALIDLGIARDLLGQHGEAQRVYRLALAIEPGRTAGTTNLGLSLALSGDPQQALTILRPISLTPGASPRMRQDLAVALVLAGDDEEAARVLQKDMPQPQAMVFVTNYRSLRTAP